MDNKILVDLEMNYITTKNGYEYVKTNIYLKGINKITNKEIVLRLKPKKEIDFNHFQYIGLKYSKLDEASIPTVKLENVEARLYKGKYQNKTYYLVKVIIDEKIKLSAFLDDTQILMLNNFVTLAADFEEIKKN